MRLYPKVCEKARRAGFPGVADENGNRRKFERAVVGKRDNRNIPPQFTHRSHKNKLAVNMLKLNDELLPFFIK
jgi:hypothetical protein